MIPVKICGITNLADALLCSSAGAASLGFVFASSPRQVTPERVAGFARKLPPFITKIGVFVDEDLQTVREIMKECRLDLVQLHGDEDPDYCEQLAGRAIKAFKAGKDLPNPDWAKIQLHAALIDSYITQAAGGTGMIFDWKLFKEFRKLDLPLILAGGLNPDNLYEAVRVAEPDAVDVSSGLEITPGLKDPQKIRRFMELARKYNSSRETVNA